MLRRKPEAVRLVVGLLSRVLIKYALRNDPQRAFLRVQHVTLGFLRNSGNPECAAAAACAQMLMNLTTTSTVFAMVFTHFTGKAPETDENRSRRCSCGPLQAWQDNGSEGTERQKPLEKVMVVAVREHNTTQRCGAGLRVYSSLAGLVILDSGEHQLYASWSTLNGSGCARQKG